MVYSMNVYLVGFGGNSGYCLPAIASSGEAGGDAGCLMLDSGCLILDTRCWIWDAGYGVLDAGYWLLDMDCWFLAIRS